MKLFLFITIFLASSFSYATQCVNHDSQFPDGSSSQSSGKVFWCTENAEIKTLDCGDCPMMQLTAEQVGDCGVLSKQNKVEQDKLTASICDKKSKRACCADAGTYKVTLKR